MKYAMNVCLRTITKKQHKINNKMNVLLICIMQLFVIYCLSLLAYKNNNWIASIYIFTLFIIKYIHYYKHFCQWNPLENVCLSKMVLHRTTFQIKDCLIILSHLSYLQFICNDNLQTSEGYKFYVKLFFIVLV